MSFKKKTVGREYILIIKSVEVECFRALKNVSFDLGNNITAIAGRNATMKTTLLGIIGQPFTISKQHPMHGAKTIDGYNFISQFKEKFKLSQTHDIIGTHKWTIKLHNKGLYPNNQIQLTSIPRGTQTGNNIRFWNATSKSKGAGYIQLPVYYLSLSRLYPIGECSRTTQADLCLTHEENEICLREYRKILSIQNTTDNNDAKFDMQRGNNARSFTGVSDGIHDVFTNSAGESNIGRIILAILSFKRLKDKYHSEYNGGILLIDELDATLYGYSQKRLVEYLYQSSKEYKIQIIFTTHSPIVLKEVNKLQREELKRKAGIIAPQISYDSSIVFLEADYMKDGTRFIKAKNITSAIELNETINDILLTPSKPQQLVNVYLEDEKAKSLLIFLFKKGLEINYENYLNLVDVDMGWSNYVQLHEKKVPEFLNSIIILDHDAESKAKKDGKSCIIEKADNILYLPVDVEEGMFKFLKNHANYDEFQISLKGINLKYDVCFRDWPEVKYVTSDYKHWFNYVVETLGSSEPIFEFWYTKNTQLAKEFIDRFIKTHNLLADKLELDNIQ